MPTRSYPADALATVTDPARVHFHPALMQDAWFRLLESRGRPVPQARLVLLQAQHLMQLAPAAPAPDPWVSVGQAIAPHQRSAMARVRQMIAERAPTGPGAA